MRAVTAVCVTTLALSGCGGGGERQDADEPEGTFEVEVVDASFAQRQRLAKSERLTITVRNSGSEAVPNVATTVEGFSFRSEQEGLSDPERPTWIVDSGPTGGQTAYTSTWALGRLAPGQTKTFTWRVTPIRPGTHTVRYRIAAGLDGRAKAVSARGGAPAGRFDVTVTEKPGSSRVDPETGRVIRSDDDES